MNYSVVKYGTEWAVFCAATRCYVLFGSKKTMKRRCKDLNTELTVTIAQKPHHV